MAGPQRLVEQIVDQVVGRVLVHVDLLEDHLTLCVQVPRADRGMLKHVAEVVDGHRQVAVEYTSVEARVLLRGERVHVAAHGVERLGDVSGRAGFRALEQKVLEEV